MIKLIIDYIKTNKYFLLTLLTILCFVTYMPIYLYRIEFEKIFYPLFLSTLISFIYIYFDIKRYIRKYNQLKISQKNKLLDISEINKNNDMIDKTYIDIIENLKKENIKIINDNKKELESITDYYTMWVHQIKIPIAALNFLIDSNIDKKNKLEIELFKIEQYVDMVLSYLRLDSEKTDFLAERINVDLLLKSVIRKQSLIFIEKKIILDYTPLDFKILSDRKWLEFALEQILSNALKYSNPNGKISIYIEGNAICIKDEGIGISSDNLPRIFDKGYTGFNGRKNKKSSGLGLYLTQKILQKLGQQIVIESDLNKGTIVKVVIEERSIIKEDIINDKG
ncbi:sensor histidine kinase [Gemella sp. GH3]|uniref:sensor histidine kinase n=1 Tax=unclassified Gemella TaxID=2624949 RepID=UPI0015D04538|nr:MULTISPECIES: sensor histidine kinase [unclassified Gemella]MBF0713833.1 sensor histidine kinase [Gemella sp. GH3.1]NYS50785.1 sensor histidine kinase [Gemella sp. GH3]